jgi:hypothetical protein
MPSRVSAWSSTTATPMTSVSAWRSVKFRAPLFS